MFSKPKHRHFHIFEYFLDGNYLKWEEIEGDLPVSGQYWVINLEDNTQVVTKVVEIEPISETESRIMLTSCLSEI